MIYGNGSRATPTDIDEVRHMKRIFKCISVFAVAAVLLAMTAVTAFASSAKTGDTIELKISVEGEKNMGSMNVQVNYDKSKFDLLSDDTLGTIK